MRNISSTAYRRRKVVHDIELSIYMVKYGAPLLILSGLVNFFLDCCGVGMIV